MHLLSLLGLPSSTTPTPTPSSSPPPQLPPDILSASMAQLQEACYKNHNAIVDGLIYAILHLPHHSSAYFECLGLLVRDGFKHAVHRIHHLSMSCYFHKLNPRTISQIIFCFNQFVAHNAAADVKHIFYFLMKQMKVSDTTPAQINYVGWVLSIPEKNKAWFKDVDTKLKGLAIYSFLRMSIDHINHIDLRNREINFVVSQLRQNFLVLTQQCGRDLVRLLQDTAKIPEIKQLWEDMLHKPKSLDPQFEGIYQILRIPTNSDFYIIQLTPEMETKLSFILKSCKTASHSRNSSWFLKKFVLPKENEYIYIDVIRWICNVHITPPHQDVVPRYVLIGYLLKCMKNHITTASAKMALVFDWMFFNPAQENIMILEPTILLIERSVDKYPYITAMMIDFLRLSVDDSFPFLAERIKLHTRSAMKVLIDSNISRGMQSLYTNDKLDPKIHSAIASLFPEFIGNNSNVIPQPPLNTSSSAAASALLPPPPLPAPSPSISTNTTHSSDSLMNSIPLPLPPPPQLQPVTKWKPLFDTLSCCLTKGANSQKSMDLCRGLLTVYLQEKDEASKTEFDALFIALLVETRGKLDDLVATTSTTYTPIASSDTEACGNFIFALWTSITDIYFQSKYPASSATGNSNKKKNNTSANAPTADFVDAPNDKLVMLLDRLIKANPEMLIYICMYTLRYNYRKFTAEPRCADLFNEFAILSFGSVEAGLMQFLEHVYDQDLDEFYRLVVPAITLFGKKLTFTCRKRLIEMITTMSDPMTSFYLFTEIQRSKFTIFGEDVSLIVEVIVSSLSWPSFEQMTLWQLIQIELTDQQLLENVMAELLPRVDKTGGCHEFFLGLTLLLRQFRPSPKLLYTILTHFKANANSSYSTEQHLKAIEHPQTLPRHPQDTDKRFLRQVFLYWTSRSAYLDEISSAAATDSSSSSSSSSPSTPLSGPATPVWMPLEAAITSSLGMIRDDMFLLEAKQKASANRPDVLKQCSIQHQEFEDLFSNLITNLLYWKEVATELGFAFPTHQVLTMVKTVENIISNLKLQIPPSID